MSQLFKTFNLDQNDLDLEIPFFSDKGIKNICNCSDKGIKTYVTKII